MAGMVGGFGCATEEATTVTWGEEATVVARRETNVHVKNQEDANAMAGTFHSSTKCTEVASDVFTSDKKAAALLMRGCMARADFTSLYPFSASPWKGLIFKEKDIPLILTVAVRRGGMEVAEDFRQLGIPVEAWIAIRNGGTTEDGALVAVVGQPIEQKRGASGFETTIRVYDFDDGQKVHSYRVDFGSSRVAQRDHVYVTGRKSRNLVPIGETIVVVSPEPLPTDRRLQLVARYDASRSAGLVRAEEARLAALPPEEAVRIKVTAEDPKPKICMRIVAFDHGTDD